MPAHLDRPDNQVVGSGSGASHGRNGLRRCLHYTALGCKVCCLATTMTEQGHQFTLALLTQLCETPQLNHISTTVYHPQVKGMADAFKGTLA